MHHCIFMFVLNTSGWQTLNKYSAPSSEPVRLSVANITQNTQCKIFCYANFGIPHFLHKIVISLDGLRFKINIISLLFVVYCLQLFF